MSGHSKWHNIKRKKEAEDQKKSKLFGRFAREIASAAREDPNPATNAALRDAIDRAEKANMPRSNIDRILERRTNADLKDATYEGFSPGGVALLIIARTDNPNRTVAEVRSLLKGRGGQMGEPGTVSWKFRELYRAEFTARGDTADELELALMDAGAEETERTNEGIRAGAPVGRKDDILAAAQQYDADAISRRMTYEPVQSARVSDEDRQTAEALIEALEAHEDVAQVYSDLPSDT